jgi:hypothetical protein
MLDADHDGELSWNEVWNSLAEHYKGYYVDWWAITVKLYFNAVW